VDQCTLILIRSGTCVMIALDVLSGKVNILIISSGKKFS
jgi:multisubunit Na+/H+ antiporter MnhC subunit